MTQNVCRRNCIECNLQPTLEAKQMCASFKTVEMLSYIEGEVFSLKEKIKSLESGPQEVNFNMNAISAPVADAPFMPVGGIKEEPKVSEAVEPEEEPEDE